MDSSNGSIFWVWKVSPFGNLRILRLFAPPRSLSQLVTSFVGSQCQGIHLMLFFAWTSFFFSYLLLWVSQIIFVYNEKASFVAFFDLPPFLTANCSFLPDFIQKNLFKICLKNYLFVSISLFGFQWSFTLQILSAGGLKWTRTTDLVLIRHAL